MHISYNEWILGKLILNNIAMEHKTTLYVNVYRTNPINSIRKSFVILYIGNYDKLEFLIACKKAKDTKLYKCK